MAPRRLSPFDRRCQHAPSPLPLAAAIEHPRRAECSDRTLVQLGLIWAHDEHSWTCARFRRAGHFGEVVVEGTRGEVVAYPHTREIYLGQ